MGWPSKGWAATLFDMCMDEKPRAAYFRAMWTDKPVLKMAVVDYSIDEDPGKDHWQTPPMVHDWTFPYTDSRVLPIHTPSNCDEVVLIDPRGKKYGPRKPKDYLNNTIIGISLIDLGRWLLSDTRMVKRCAATAFRQVKLKQHVSHLHLTKPYCKQTDKTLLSLLYNYLMKMGCL